MDNDEATINDDSDEDDDEEVDDADTMLTLVDSPTDATNENAADDGEGA